MAKLKNIDYKELPVKDKGVMKTFFTAVFVVFYRLWHKIYGFLGGIYFYFLDINGNEFTVWAKE